MRTRPCGTSLTFPGRGTARPLLGGLYNRIDNQCLVAGTFRRTFSAVKPGSTRPSHVTHDGIASSPAVSRGFVIVSLCVRISRCAWRCMHVHGFHVITDSSSFGFTGMKNERRASRRVTAVLRFEWFAKHSGQRLIALYRTSQAPAIRTLSHDRIPLSPLDAARPASALWLRPRPVLLAAALLCSNFGAQLSMPPPCTSDASSDISGA